MQRFFLDQPMFGRLKGHPAHPRLMDVLMEDMDLQQWLLLPAELDMILTTLLSTCMDLLHAAWCRQALTKDVIDKTMTLE
jgi:hypothetical protein